VRIELDDSRSSLLNIVALKLQHTHIKVVTCDDSECQVARRAVQHILFVFIFFLVQTVVVSVRFSHNIIIAIAAAATNAIKGDVYVDDAGLQTTAGIQPCKPARVQTSALCALPTRTRDLLP
jgi:hypothetical protein